MALKLKPLLLVTSIALALSGCGESVSSNNGEGHAQQKVNENQNQGNGDNNSNGGDNGGDGQTPTFDEASLLSSLVDNVITPTFTEFDSKAKTQPAIVKAYCDLEASYDPTMGDEDAKTALEEAKNAAQNAWKETMVSWQHAELMIVGPLLANDKSLRNRIYSWPNASTCSVDQDVVFFAAGDINGNAYDISKRSDKRRGLDAMEYLLFNENMAHSCSANAAESLNDWNTQSEQSRKVARCQFAVEVAKDLSDSATELLYEWSGEDGYSAKFKNAGQPGNPYSTTLNAINEISDALFYMTEELKDYKLATPLGLFDNKCGNIACPEEVESIYAKHSIENIRANIAAFEKIFLGGTSENTGFDDFLDSNDATDTKELMLKGITDAKAAADAISTDLQTALTNDTTAVEHNHAKVKDVTDQLKNDFINKLALELPKTSAGDND